MTALKFFGMGKEKDQVDPGSEPLNPPSESSATAPSAEETPRSTAEAEGTAASETPAPEAGAAEAQAAAPESDTQTPAPEEPTTEEIISQLRAEAEANYDKYLRALAEMENQRKRAIKERSDLLKYAGENLARDLLDVADNFDRALSHADTSSREEFAAGVKLIRDQFMGILTRYQVKPESASGGTFDPSKHDALASVPTADAAPGTILEELRKAYFFKDKLLRPAQVVVAIAPPAPPPVEPPSESTAPADQNALATGNPEPAPSAPEATPETAPDGGGESTSQENSEV